jgi:glycerol-3-phosphate dehydrogenase
VYRLHALAAKNGVFFLTENEVIGVSGHTNHIELALSYRDGRKETIHARVVVNAAGVEADKMARLLNPASVYEWDPIKGESYKFYSDRRPELKVAGTNIYPTPETVITAHGRHFTVGVHLTPTFEDLTYPPRLGATVTVGPKVVPAQDKGSEETERITADFMAKKVQRFFPGIKAEDLSWHQAGEQARLKGHPDFVITSDPTYPHCINLLGIDSPGLTAALAIGKKTARKVHALLD